jgi:hypothetical protein
MTGRPYEKLNEYGGKADSLVRKSIVNLASVSGNRLGRKYTVSVRATHLFDEQSCVFKLNG